MEVLMIRYRLGKIESLEKFWFFVFDPKMHSNIQLSGLCDHSLVVSRILDHDRSLMYIY